MEETTVGEETKEVTPPLEEAKVETKVETEVAPEENPEVKQKAAQLANLNKAIADETVRLREIRKNQKKAKLGLEIDEEDELPEIDMKDPSAKAWDKRINDATRPANRELEKAKEERRLFTLRQFLSDKPSLASNPEKIKAMMETYDRLKTSTELTSEGIQMDLEKAYAAEHAEELITRARQSRVDDARNDALFSDIAVSRGSTSYSKEAPKPKVYTEEEKAQLAKWGMTPAQHSAMIDAQNKKVE
jgi:hypothetical protein